MNNMERMDPDTERKLCREIIEEIKKTPNMNKDRVTAIKSKVLGRLKLKAQKTIKNSILLDYLTPEEEYLRPLIARKITRTLSGVTVVAIMTKPLECPGKCIFCPGPSSQPGEKAAQSYTGREPAALRSIMFGYDSYKQTLSRMLDLHSIGHTVDKIEVICMGGTFLSAPVEYQDKFIAGSFQAISDYKSKLAEFGSNPDYTKDELLIPYSQNSLDDLIVSLETCPTKLVGVTFETRPDYCDNEHIDRMLYLGGTRVEIGAQSTKDSFLVVANRKHSTQDVKNAIRKAKDAGLKINLHMMPNLPGSTPESDYQVFKDLFDDPDYRPDMLKIYPCLVVEGTELYKMWKSGEYKPYSQEDLIKMIIKVKTEVLEPYVRIQRIQRDIPADLILDGVRSSNLRQIIDDEMQSKGLQCRCIRCREEGLQRYLKNKISNPDNYQINIMEYESSSGKDLFISLDDQQENLLIGFVRLRFPSETAHRKEISTVPTAIVREIRVVGEIVAFDQDPNPVQIQHRGFGRQLLEKAENIARERGYQKMVIISGIGVKEYFGKFGYEKDGPYVSKKL